MSDDYGAECNPFIENFIDELGKKFHIKEIAFDRWGAAQMVQNLEGLGFYGGSLRAGFQGYVTAE